MNNILKDMVEKRKLGIHCGITSFCCANKIVIEAILDHAKRVDDVVVIEATSNQVNQENGYMDMTPDQFVGYVYRIADKIGFSGEKIIIGGDHMGPLPWVNLPEAEAMEKAKELVGLCVRAGYKKIHLDTSMYLASDDRTIPLSDEIIAQRGVLLYRECQKIYEEMKQRNPDELQPVYVIGSEVPAPGGKQGAASHVKVTSKEDFESELLAYKKEFARNHMADAWDNIIAFVVQPGIEFAGDYIQQYDRYKARELCECLRKYPDIVFEGHSTDYQPPQKLREMVEDGIAVIKVGPALTFSYREGIFALCMIEKELVDESRQSNLMEILEQEMLKEPKHWQQYYKGENIAAQRKYSYSDRSRYYMSLPDVEEARRKLFANIDGINIPVSMLRQYLPVQYAKVRDGLLQPKARELIKDHIAETLDDYYYAVKYNYMANGISIH